jgi:hypothetical protein
MRRPGKRGNGPREEKREWAQPKKELQFFYFCLNFKRSQLVLIQRLTSWAPKISNKILACRELNKEQLSILELFKIQDRIWIKK